MYSASLHLPGQPSRFAPRASHRGQRAPAATQPRDNSVLACLTEAHSHEVLQALQLVALPCGRELIGDLYFPTSGVVCFVHEFENGRSAEFALTGSEGVVGLPRFFSGGNSPYHAVVTSAGYAYRLAGKDLQHEEWRGGKELRYALLCYAHAFITQIALTAVSNRHDTIDQQLCRWLLLSLDRLLGDELRITQDLIATMLGVRRESVTQAFGTLQSRGMLRCSRGRITILDRAGLEAMAGECYRISKRGYDRLVPRPLH